LKLGWLVGCNPHVYVFVSMDNSLAKVCQHHQIFVPFIDLFSILVPSFDTWFFHVLVVVNFDWHIAKSWGLMSVFFVRCSCNNMELQLDVGVTITQLQFI